MNGPKIGPYTLGKTLGMGTFSRVKWAVHDITGEEVAIKILNRSKLRKMDMGAKVRREIDVLKLFDHPHIVRLYEVIDTESDLFCVMEFCEGGEMFEYIVERGRLDEDEARVIFQQIISGVEYCHVNMVVHRDLKPENILLNRQTKRVKLADFGLSNIMKDGQFLKTSCGSPNYAAPEVISGNLYAGPEVDVWSCGVILYALLCGSLPFDDENIRNLFRKIKGGVYSIPTYVSDSAADLIQRMLIVDPIKRIRVSEIRNHPWFLVNLPRYLQMSAQQRITLSRRVDDEVVDEVVQYGQGSFTRDQVLDAIGRAQNLNLLTSRRMAGYTDLRKMAVTYRLLLDKKRRSLIEQGRSYEDNVDNSLLLPSPAELHRPVREPALPPLTAEQNLTHSENNRKKSSKKQSKQYYLGVWSRLDPFAIMNELLRTLKVCGFEWKVLAPYKIKARYLYHNVSPIQMEPPKMVKIGIQLYRSHNFFMLDIQKLHGELFPFMDTCADLLQELRITDNVIGKSRDSKPSAGAQNLDHEWMQHGHGESDRDVMDQLHAAEAAGD